jgi:diguanylate cyclase (GGDEF)-like protein
MADQRGGTIDDRRPFGSVVVHRVDGLSVRTTVTIAILVGSLVTALDVLTGSELSFSIFYVLPVGLVAWRLGRTQGILTAICAAAAWSAADLASGHVYSRPLVPVWNGVVRLSFFAIIGAMTSSLRRLLRGHADEARHDALTGLLNRRGFAERAELEIERAHRSRRALTLVCLDLDDFKRVNDTAGHAAGDAQLQRFGSVTRATLRAIDVIGRIGGDEFALLFPDTSTGEALIMIERLRTALADVEPGGIPFSLGVLGLGDPMIDVDEALKQADDLMYRHKAERGRPSDSTA